MRKYIVLFLLVAVTVLSAGAQSLEREAFLDAESRFLSRAYPLALERYDEFLRSWPDSAYSSDARYRRSVTLYRLGRSTEAYEGFSTVEARYRSTKYLAYVPFWKAVIEYDRGELERAATRFTILAQKPPDPESLRLSLVYLGKASTALDRPSQAKAAFERLLDEIEAPESEGSALIFLADLYAKDSESEKLAALWKRIDPDKLDTPTRERIAIRVAEAFSLLGRDTESVALFESLSSSPRREIAISALQRLFVEARRSGDETRISATLVKAENALRASPEQLSEFWLRVGEGAFRDGRLDLARSYFLRISALLPPQGVHPDVPIYMAEIAAREGNTEEAFAILSSAATLDAGDREALLKTRLGWYALGLKRWADAGAALSGALAAIPSEANEYDREIERAARSYLAYALYREDQAASGLEVLAEADALSLPGMARLRAELLRKAGRAADALQALDELVVADSGDAEARVAQMSLFFENGRHSRVVAAAAELDKIAPDGKGLGPSLRASSMYLAGISSAATGDFALALSRLEKAREAGFGLLGPAASWAAYYRAWALYRLSRFEEARSSFDAFISGQGEHPRAYSAAYLAAWSAINLADYRSGAAFARKAADMTARTPVDGLIPGLPKGSDAGEEKARAAFLEGTARTFMKDWEGAVAAYDRAIAARSGLTKSGLTSYTVRAAYERAAAFDLSGSVDAADEAFSLVSRNYPADPLASEAAYRRGELMYRAKRWTTASERFASYRETYRSGPRADAALYFGGLSIQASGKTDAAILLWERLLTDYKTSRYRFASILAAARAYKEKRDWEAAFRSYTSAIAEFGDNARKAGAGDEAEVLRYLITGLPEKAARLHMILSREGGASTAVGRAAALDLARFYIRESAQREAGLPLLDETIAMRNEDTVSAAEAAFLKGEYFGAVEAFDKAALAYLDAVAYATGVPIVSSSGAIGQGLREDFIPESLFRAVSMRLRLGKKDSAAEIQALLVKNYPSSTWTTQARRLLEGN